MSYIGKKVRKTERVVPDPAPKRIPLPTPAQQPERIEAPNWPLPQPIPITIPEKVEVLR